MIDGHVHIESGPYTLEWINRYVEKAVGMHLDEIRLLEHCYRYKEFTPMYAPVRAYSAYNEAWYQRRTGVYDLADYLALVDQVRREHFPIKVLFGLEVCYFRESEDLIAACTKDMGFDFLLGSVHFLDGFAYDHTAELWDGIDVDQAYRTYFESAIDLAKSGLFDGLGHPDAIKLFGHKPSFSLEAYYERLAQALSDSHMYADQNSGVSRRCHETAPIPGMDTVLLQALKKHHVPIITSSDAHCPEDVGYRIAEMEQALREYR